MAKVSADIEMWELIKSSKDPTDFESFLDAFPNSQFVPIARLKLKRLKGSENVEPGDWIKDQSTGLIWENVSSGKKFNWKRIFINFPRSSFFKIIIFIKYFV